MIEDEIDRAPRHGPGPRPGIAHLDRAVERRQEACAVRAEERRLMQEVRWTAGCQSMRRRRGKWPAARHVPYARRVVAVDRDDEPAVGTEPDEADLAALAHGRLEQFTSRDSPETDGAVGAS